jgi:Astacin (Peptidase family M12A)
MRSHLVMPALLALTGLFASCGQPVVQAKPEQPATPQDVARTPTDSANGTLSDATRQTLISAPYLKHTLSNGETLLIDNIGEHTFIHGTDVAIGRRSALPTWILNAEDRLRLKATGVGLKSGQTDPFGAPRLWPSAKDLNVIYYEIGSFPANIRNNIQAAIDTWNATNVAIKWQPRPTISNYAYATIVGSNSWSLGELLTRSLPCQNLAGISSAVGYDNPNNFPVGGTIYINPNCFSALDKSDANTRTQTIALVMHEMGHVMGLGHEQQYCGRNNYINVNPPTSPNSFDVAYSFNFAEACGTDARNYGLYDFSSLMHYTYGQYGTATVTMSQKANIAGSYCGSPSLAGLATTLSKQDVFAINTMYGKTPIISGC